MRIKDFIADRFTRNRFTGMRFAQKDLLLGAALFCGVACLQAQQMPLSLQMAEAHGMRDFKPNRETPNELATTGWDYVSGLVANALLKVYQQYPDRTDFYDAAKAFADFSTSADGTFICKAPDKTKNALSPSNIDDLAAGKIFFKLYTEEVRRGNYAEAERYRNAATLIRNKLKHDHSRIPAGLEGEGGFYHKAVYPCQMWLDGLYMGPAMYAEWQHYFGLSEGREADSLSWTDIALQFKILHKHTYDPEKQLCYHGWSATPDDKNSFWARKDGPFKGCSPEFWGRGMGWYFAALVDILEWMPKNHPDYKPLVDNLNQIAAGLKRWQDNKTGCWFQLLQYDAKTKSDGKGDTVEGKTYNVGDNPNYIEASATCMYTYCFYKGVRLGLLDESYLAIADKAFEGIKKNLLSYEGKMRKLTLKNCCNSAGLGPAKDHSRTGTVNYYLNGKDTKIVASEGKAVGPFIMAALENELRHGQIH